MKEIAIAATILAILTAAAYLFFGKIALFFGGAVIVFFAGMVFGWWILAKAGAGIIDDIFGNK